MKSVKDTFRLINGVDIPCVGYGTFQIPDGEQAVRHILQALEAGYRHIDTASAYGNEKSVGKAVEISGLDRKDVFITSKVWNDDQGFEPTLRAFDRTMKKLGLDYLDLYLIHWPRVKNHEDDWVRLNRETWQAMERLYEDGRVRAIGVSNFKPHHISSLMEMSTILPMVDQIELHPGYNQMETVEFCRNNGILIEAWSPFSRGKLFDSAELDQISRRHEKTPAQIALRWLLQHGILPLPKSATLSRIIENTKIFDFRLPDDDMAFIDNIKGVKSSEMDPDKVAL